MKAIGGVEYRTVAYNLVIERWQGGTLMRKRKAIIAVVLATCMTLMSTAMAFADDSETCSSDQSASTSDSGDAGSSDTGDSSSSGNTEVQSVDITDDGGDGLSWTSTPPDTAYVEKKDDGSYRVNGQWTKTTGNASITDNTKVTVNGNAATYISGPEGEEGSYYYKASDSSDDTSDTTDTSESSDTVSSSDDSSSSKSDDDDSSSSSGSSGSSNSQWSSPVYVDPVTSAINTTLAGTTFTASETGSSLPAGSSLAAETPGPVAQVVFAQALPTGWAQAFSFVIKTYSSNSYTVKNGKVTISIPAQFKLAGRKFALMGIDKDGVVHIFDDLSPEDGDSISVDLDLEGYAFQLIYTD